MSGWVDGVHPPRCVEWRWCVLLLSCPVRWCGSCPTHPIAVLASTAVMSCSVSCRVCGVWVVSICVCCSCGGVSSVCYPPHVGGGWGYCGWWGGIACDGWHGEGRAAVLLASPLNVGAPVCVLAPPPSRLLGGRVEWRGVVCAVMPRLRIGSGTLCCSTLSRIVQSPFHRLCPLSQHCWFSAVFLWQGCVIVE